MVLICQFDRMFLFAACLIGLLVPVQSAANARLGLEMGHPAIAAAFSLLIGGLAVSLALLLLHTSLPPVAALRATPIWTWFGGIIGATFILGSILLVPRVGASAFVVAVMAGQLLSALLIDRFGWLGIPAQGVSLWRIAGVVLIAMGAVAIGISGMSHPPALEGRSTEMKALPAPGPP